MSEPSIPTFNHIAMSVEPGLLEADRQLELLSFHREVFGWTEMPGMSRPRELLVMRVHSNEQFVYLAADPEPMRCPALDHFGLSVQTPDDLYAVYERAKLYRSGIRGSRSSSQGRGFRGARAAQLLRSLSAADDGRAAMLRVGRGSRPRQPARRSVTADRRTILRISPRASC